MADEVVAKRGKGGPTELTPELMQTFLECVGNGLFFKAACDYCGITQRTANNWRRWGMDAESGIYRDFFLGVQKARSEHLGRHLANINRAAEGGNWQASAWTCERVHGLWKGREVHAEEDAELEQADGSKRIRTHEDVIAKLREMPRELLIRALKGDED